MRPRVALVLALAATAVAGAPARADVLTVNTPNDAQPPWHCPALGDIPCTLRAAVGQSDDDGGGDVVSLPAGHYTLDDTIVVLHPIDIVGAGRDSTVIDGGDTGNPAFGFRPNGAARLARLTVTNFGAAAIASLNSKPLTLDEVAVTDNTTDRKDVGAGLIVFSGSVDIENSLFAGNHAGIGGAIALLPGTESATIRDSELRDNRSFGLEGGGGALLVGSGNVDIARTRIDRNLATEGGALATLPSDDHHAAITIEDSLIADNQATAGEGGGIYMNPLASSTLTLASDTFAGNAAPRAGSLGGDLFDVSLIDTVLTGARGGECTADHEVIALGHDVADDASCGLSGPGDSESADARLDASSVPLPDSPLLDAADPTTCVGDVSNDVRGVTRPQGDGCDIGALERPASGPLAQTGTATGSSVSGSVDPGGLATTVVVEYGPTDSYGSATAPQLVRGWVPVAVTADLGVLPPGVVHYRVVATNSSGTSTGDDATFTVPTPAPAGPPVSATPPPVATGLRISRLHVRPGRSRVGLAWTATSAGATRFVLTRHGRALARFTLASRRGGNHADLPRRLHPGRYRLSAPGAAAPFTVKTRRKSR